LTFYVVLSNYVNMQTRHFANQGLCFCLAIFGLVGSSHAQTYATPPAPRPIEPVSDSGSTSSTSATVTKGKDGRLQIAPQSDNTTAQPTSTNYVLKAEPRAPATGYSVSVMAGANLAQEDDITTFGGIPTTSNSGIAPTGGLKFGYTWPFSDEPIDQFDMETSSVGGVRISGGLELEGLYVRNSTELNNAVGSNKLDMDMGFLMINATLQAQWGDFRIYGGPGVGLAIVGTDDDTQAELAYQILGGLDYFIAPDWSIFAEYKYLIINRLVITTPNGNTDFGDQFGQHLLSLGLRKHF